MPYREFMRKILEITSYELGIKWTVTEVKKQAERWGIKLNTDLEAIQLIEIASKYEISIY